MRYPQICMAIREKRLLRLTYEFTTRVVEPHAYGVTDEGHEMLHAWQHQPLPDSWKIFRLDRAIGLSVADARFDRPRSDYKRGDKAMQRTYCEL